MIRRLLLVFCSIVALTGCTTVDGKRVFDPKKAVDAACAAKPALVKLAEKAVCDGLEGAEKARCERIKDIASLGGDAALIMLGKIYDACNVNP